MKWPPNPAPQSACPWGQLSTQDDIDANSERSSRSSVDVLAQALVEGGRKDGVSQLIQLQTLKALKDLRRKRRGDS